VTPVTPGDPLFGNFIGKRLTKGNYREIGSRGVTGTRPARSSCRILHHLSGGWAVTARETGRSEDFLGGTGACGGIATSTEQDDAAGAKR